jgi:HEAT repeat protein
VLVLSAGGLAACTPEASERRVEIYELRENPTPENVARIRDRLRDVDRDVRATALHALVAMSVDDARELALSAVRDADGFVRATAAKLLGDLRAVEATPVLARLLIEDPDPIVRQRCAESLRALGGEQAERSLFEALEDPTKQVRLAALEGAIALNPAGGFDRLALLVLQDPEWEVRARAASALGLTGRSEAKPLLGQALEDPNEFVRAAAARALEQLTAGRR